tara:strand:- start:40 stop:567 length:528 start_codon:yes stop_codon:yes gene_type:complete
MASTLTVDNIVGATTAGNVKLPAGSILQCKSGTINSRFQTSSTSFVDVTGFNVNITPKYSTSKILVQLSAVSSLSAVSRVSRFRVIRTISGGSAVHVGAGDADGTDGFSGTRTVYDSGSDELHQVHWQGEDSPSTTTAISYKIMCCTNGGTMNVNDRNNGDMSQTSTITVWELSQ